MPFLYLTHRLRLPIVSPVLDAALFSNTMKDFNPFSTSRYIAKMHMDGGNCMK